MFDRDYRHLQKTSLTVDYARCHISLHSLNELALKALIQSYLQDFGQYLLDETEQELNESIEGIRPVDIQMLGYLTSPTVMQGYEEYTGEKSDAR